MLNSDQDLDVNSNRQVAKSQSRQYPPIVTELSIEQSKAMPIFTEATALAIRLTDAPVAILTAIGTSSCQIASISGLEHFRNLPTHPDLLVEFLGLEYCHDRSIAEKSSFIVTNCQKHPHLAQSSLCQVHGIQAYLGVPIVTASDDRLGTLAILDFKHRQFSDRDIDLLRLISRLVASEFERKLLSQAQLNQWIGDLRYRSIAGFDDRSAASEYSESMSGIDRSPIDYPTTTDNRIAYPLEDRYSVADRVRGDTQFELLTHLTQELRTPLTSVLGMASVLQQEIYGPLSGKQKDYLGIIHHSGQQLVTIVDEIAQLVGGDLQQHQLNLQSVDLEMLCQLAIQSLEPLAQKKQQQILLNFPGEVAPPERIWLLDKNKVRQIIYYLCLSAIDASAIDRQISIQIAHFTDRLQIHITTNDPQAILPDRHGDFFAHRQNLATDRPNPTKTTQIRDLRISLGLSLSHEIAVLHGGQIAVTSNGRGYQLTLPLIVEADKANHT